MKLTNLIWVLALAGSVAACNSGPPITGEINPGPGTGNSNGAGATGGAPTSGACINEDDAAVYECLEFTDGKGEEHSGTDASSAIGSECVRGSTSSDPPIEGCGGETLDVVACFPTCPDATVQALADCVRDCTQDTTAELCPPGLTDDCVECTGATVACGAAFCTNACVADTTAQGCIDCRCDNGCTPEFVVCSGIPSDDC
jgi:hypothetical protein